MRKVLLATTALVALGGVSAASADISVSVSNEMKYSSWSSSVASSNNKTSVTNDSTVKISASTVTDNGLSMSSYAANDATTSFDDFGFSIAGDFGTIGFKGSEAGDKFATAADVTADEGQQLAQFDVSGNAMVLPADESVAGSDISYLSPDISGFQFAIGMADSGLNSDTTSMGAQYSMSSGDATITVKYASSEAGSASGADGVEATSMGLVIGYGDATLTVAQNTKKLGSTYDYTGDSFGVTYKMSDALTLQAYTGTTEDSQDAAHEISDTGLGLTYTVTPGLSVSVTNNSTDLKDTEVTNEDSNVTTIAINLSF
jgi:hypothetical protein